MFNYPATELFRADERRVVWSAEEFAAALLEGWSEDRPAVAPSAEEPPAKAEKAATAKKQPKTSE